MNKIHLIPTLEDNYTYLVAQVENTCVLIDCGEAVPVLSYLKEKNLTPAALLCTHHHGDHVAGIKDLKKTYPFMVVYGNEVDRARIPAVERGLNDGQILHLGDLAIHCIETKGHTQHHLCYYLKDQNTLFSGDTLFSLSCGRLFEGTAEDMFTSLQKFNSLPDDTLLYCGHEYTLKNMQFIKSLGHNDSEILAEEIRIRDLRNKNLPTLPSTFGFERKFNPFIKASSSKEIAQLRELRDKF